MTMTRDKIEELTALLRDIRPNYGDVGTRDVDVARQQKQIDRAIDLLALAERALEPQGQVLPELPPPAYKQQYVCTKCGATGKGTGAAHNRLDGSPCSYMASHHGPWFTADQMRAYGRKCASQLALPAGPVPEGWKLVAYTNREKLDRLTSKPEKSTTMWSDALIEDGDIALYMRSPAVAQPVADERDAERLEWVSHAWGGQRHDYANHVLSRGGDGDLSDIRTFIDKHLPGRAALCQPAEEKKPHEWSTLRRSKFDVFSEDGTLYTTVQNSLEALSYLENGWRVEEQKSGQPAEEGDKA